MRNCLRRVKNFFIGLIPYLCRYLHNNRYSLINCRIPSSTIISNCNISNYCHIGENCSLNRVDLGSYCAIANAVHIGGMEHSWWGPSISTWLSDECEYKKRTTIGHDVWIGASSIVRQGVTIGDGAVIGANSYVNKDVPPYAIVVGSPAKIIKYRFGERTQKLLNESEYWIYAPSKARRILKNIKSQINSQ